MEKILPAHFVAYLHEYTTRQNNARLSLNEIALMCCLALTPPSMSTDYMVDIGLRTAVVVGVVFVYF